MKIRIGYGLGTQGLDHAPGDGSGYTQLVDDLERLNYDSVWFSERLNGNAPDPCALMAYTAGRTQRLKMGMSVMVLPGRSPVLVAKELASIALLAGPGRLLPAFGLGAPDPREHQAFGVAREDRAPMFNESLEVIRRIWREESVTHHGRFFHYDGLSIGPRLPRAPEVWLGGIAPSELRRVGRLADGWLPSFITPQEAPDLKAKVEAAAAEAERAIEEDHFGVLIVYSSGAPLGGPFLDRVRARRPDVTDSSDLFPVGLGALRAHIERFVASGYTKFVLLPATDLRSQPGGVTAELERVAEQILTLEN